MRVHIISVFLGIMTLLAVKLDAKVLRCNKLEYLALEKQPTILISHADRCDDGYCTFEQGNTHDSAGCTKFWETNEVDVQKFVKALSYYKGKCSQEISCDTDRCNTDEHPYVKEVERIQEILDGKLLAAEGNSTLHSQDLKCHGKSGKSGECKGYCYLKRQFVNGKAQKSQTHCIQGYGMDRPNFQYSSLVYSEGEIVSVSGHCSVNDCNAEGAILDKLLQEVKKEVENSTDTASVAPGPGNSTMEGEDDEETTTSVGLTVSIISSVISSIVFL